MRALHLCHQSILKISWDTLVPIYVDPSEGQVLGLPFHTLVEAENLPLQSKVQPPHVPHTAIALWVLLLPRTSALSSELEISSWLELHTTIPWLFPTTFLPLPLGNSSFCQGTSLKHSLSLPHLHDTCYKLSSVGALTEDCEIHWLQISLHSIHPNPWGNDYKAWPRVLNAGKKNIEGCGLKKKAKHTT